MTDLINHKGDIWLVVPPVDCRRGVDGLSSQVEQLGIKPCNGSVLVFRNAVAKTSVHDKNFKSQRSV